MKVDCHCHILPGLDDGAESLEAESLYDWIGSDLHGRKYAAFFEKYVFSAL